MRFAFIFLSLLSASLLAPGADAAPKAKSKVASSRMPAETAKASYRAVSISCRDESGEVLALGLGHLAIDLKTSDTGYFGLTLYVRTSKGQLAPKSLNGAFTSVPDGYVLKASWPGAPGDTLFIHLHPRDKTMLPGVNAKLACAVDGQVEQL